ncbi:epoxide hydrolase family protein [Parafrankia sp. EUN1f]|uniref:epoxide hydrolase family protein n=1 Tax=Parafrankia sp. EUN1f TaxID=102897 RepID=UPI0001C46BC7|nr:epoxide hydrolase family protein [Parafrankia sp. EUN1f]EFC82196.1 Microsomal epoxide hydrolase [Parafrankia sp. EUN1f]
MRTGERAGREPEVPPGRVTPFRINTPEDSLERIRQRLAEFDPTASSKRPGWQPGWRSGTDPTTLEALIRYWLTDYDWRQHEHELNAFEQFTAAVDGLELHVLREPGSGTAPPTVLLLHGWPSSFATFRAVIRRLAHPETVGGDPEDGLTVVVPSLPGYGFSTLAAAPLGVRSAGHLLHRLLTEVLGETRYYVHGGDQGAPIAEWMAFDHPGHCAGLHTTLLGVRHDGAPLGSGLTGVADPSADETAFTQRERDLNTGPLGAYFLLQLTAPLTLAPALADSPAGFAAWVLEKFHLWSDPAATGSGPALTTDDIITEMMIYLVSGSVTSSLVAYSELFTDPITLPPGRAIEVPSAFAAFPDPRVVTPPASFVARSRNLVRFTEPPRGGHFPAIEVPDIFAVDLAEFVRQTERTSTTR